MEVSACEANNTGGHGLGRTEREEATLGRHLDRLLRCSSEATKVTKAKQKSQKEQEHLFRLDGKQALGFSPSHARHPQRREIHLPEHHASQKSLN